MKITRSDIKNLSFRELGKALKSVYLPQHREREERRKQLAKYFASKPEDFVLLDSNN